MSMTIFIAFVGQAEALAAQYEGVGATNFSLGAAAAHVVPGIGDLLLLRMPPGPDIRRFRCTGRRFDFSEAAKPLLHIELDMP